MSEPVWPLASPEQLAPSNRRTVATVPMTTTPSRRWFRFTLRTMFMLVTGLCVWLGWQVRIVSHRKSVRSEFESRSVAFKTGDDWRSQRVYWRLPDSKLELVTVSRIRQLLGDEPIPMIFAPLSLETSEVRRLEATFPEAWLRFDSPPSPPATE